MARTAGESRGWGLIACLGGLAVAQSMGCDPVEDDGNDTGDAGVDTLILRVLEDAGSQVILPALNDFAALAADLSGKAADFRAAAESGGDVDATGEALRTAWFDATDAWQELEAMQVGPAASSLTAAGGLDLRDELYSWPTVNRCRVEQELVEDVFDEADFFSANLVNSYGFDALEVLLFAPGYANDCPPQVPINADGTWDDLGEAGIDLQRARFSAVLAEGVSTVADELVTEWSADGGDFAALLANPGEGDSPYEDETLALNALYDALFYLEIRTKVYKLATPLGLRDCTTCQDDVEAPYAGVSHEWIAANLRGFRTLFTGGEAYGFDDLLLDVGHGDLSDDILAALDDADAAAAALTVPVDVAAKGDDTAAVALHDALAVVAGLVKNELATVLMLEVPSEGAGDND